MRQLLVADPEAVQRIRLQRGLSQRELAARAGCARRTVQNAEAGRLAQLSTIRRLAEALDVEPTRIARLVKLTPGC